VTAMTAATIALGRDSVPRTTEVVDPAAALPQPTSDATSTG
jgi:hypothetical protein